MSSSFPPPPALAPGAAAAAAVRPVCDKDGDKVPGGRLPGGCAQHPGLKLGPPDKPPSICSGLSSAIPWFSVSALLPGGPQPGQLPVLPLPWGWGSDPATLGVVGPLPISSSAVYPKGLELGGGMVCPLGSDHSGSRCPHCPHLTWSYPLLWTSAHCPTPVSRASVPTATPHSDRMSASVTTPCVPRDPSRTLH